MPLAIHHSSPRTRIGIYEWGYFPVQAAPKRHLSKGKSAVTRALLKAVSGGKSRLPGSPSLLLSWGSKKERVFYCKALASHGAISLLSMHASWHIIVAIYRFLVSEEALNSETIRLKSI